jgi:GST-like protein
MLKFYYSGAPNPTKVALFLEETGMPYEAIPVDTRKGEQHKPDYLAINPNAKLPAMVDGDVTVFDSNAILLYLAEKTGKFLPPHRIKTMNHMLMADVTQLDASAFERIGICLTFVAQYVVTGGVDMGGRQS